MGDAASCLKQESLLLEASISVNSLLFSLGWGGVGGLLFSKKWDSLMKAGGTETAVGLNFSSGATVKACGFKKCCFYT